MPIFVKKFLAVLLIMVIFIASNLNLYVYAETTDINETENFISNYSFEEGFVKFWSNDTEKVSVTYKEKRTGRRALHISGQNYALCDVYNIREQAEYVLTAWVKTDGDLGAGYATLNVDEYNSRAYVNGIGPGSQANAKVSKTSGWQKIELRFTTSSNVDNVKCLFRLYGNGVAYFDDVGLYKVKNENDIETDNQVMGILSEVNTKDNIIGNYSFEKLGDIFSISNSYVTFIAKSSDNECTHSGSYGAKMTGDSALMYTVRNFEKGAEYVTAAWVKTLGVMPSGFFFTFNIDGYTSDGILMNDFSMVSPYSATINTSSSVMNTDSEWKRIAFKFTVPDNLNLSYYTISFRSYGLSSGTVYIDDVGLYKIKGTAEAEADNAALASLIGVSEKDNLLSNPGFESGKACYWFNDANLVTLESLEKNVRNGENSLKITTTKSSPLAMQRVYNIKAGTKYIVSAWVKTEGDLGNTYATFKLEGWDSSNRPDQQLQTFVSKKIPGAAASYTYGEWKLIAYEFTTPNEGVDSIAIMFRLYGKDNGGTVYIDDVGFYESKNQSGIEFFETDNVFYYTDNQTGTAILKVNTDIYEELNNGSVDFYIMSGETVKSAETDIPIIDGNCMYCFSLNRLENELEPYKIKAVLKDVYGNIFETSLSGNIYKCKRPSALRKDGVYIWC